MRIELHADTLDRVCDQHQLTRCELASRLGLTLRSVRRVGTGQSMPSTRFIARLLLLTGERIEALFTSVSESKP